MNLKTELNAVLDKMKTALGVFILDADGLIVEKAERGEVTELENAFVVFMQGFRSINQTASEMDLGTLDGLAIQTSGFQYLLRRIDGSYILAMALAPDGCLGEGKYRLKRAAENVASEFNL